MPNVPEKGPSGWNPRVVLIERRVKVIPGFERAACVSVVHERAGACIVRSQFWEHPPKSACFEFWQAPAFAQSNVRVRGSRLQGMCPSGSHLVF